MSVPAGGANPPAASGTELAAAPFCDVVVISYNQRDRLLACLQSVRAASAGAHLIVVDNASADGSAAAARNAFPHATVLALDHNAGFGAAVNRGARLGVAPYVLLLNNDARLRQGALDRLRAALEESHAAAVGPRILGPDGAPELSVDRTLSPFNEARFKVLELFYADGHGPAARRVARSMERSRFVRSLSGACLLVRRSTFESVGGFDERFFLYAEDVDLCRRLRAAGGTLRYVADAVVDHDRGASAAVEARATALHYRRSQIAFYRKHHGALATRALRAYLALRFAFQRLVGGRRQRALAADLLRLALRETGE